MTTRLSHSASTPKPFLLGSKHRQLPYWGHNIKLKHPGPCRFHVIQALEQGVGPWEAHCALEGKMASTFFYMSCDYHQIGDARLDCKCCESVLNLKMQNNHVLRRPTLM